MIKYLWKVVVRTAVSPNHTMTQFRTILIHSCEKAQNQKLVIVGTDHQVSAGTFYTNFNVTQVSSTTNSILNSIKNTMFLFYNFLLPWVNQETKEAEVFL